MYLRFDTDLEFPALARALREDLTEETIEWDSENVYEWMYVDLQQLSFSLNVSRDHGLAYVDDETLDLFEDNRDELRQFFPAGPTYVFGWNRIASDFVDRLPDFLPSFIADRLSVPVAVFNGRINVSTPDGEPLTVINPRLKP